MRTTHLPQMDRQDIPESDTRDIAIKAMTEIRGLKERQADHEATCSWRWRMLMASFGSGFLCLMGGIGWVINFLINHSTLVPAPH